MARSSNARPTELVGNQSLKSRCRPPVRKHLLPWHNLLPRVHPTSLFLLRLWNGSRRPGVSAALPARSSFLALPAVSKNSMNCSVRKPRPSVQHNEGLLIRSDVRVARGYFITATTLG